MDDFLKTHLRNSNSYTELTGSLKYFQVDSPATVTALDAIAGHVNDFYEQIRASYKDPIFEATPPQYPAVASPLLSTKYEVRSTAPGPAAPAALAAGAAVPVLAAAPAAPAAPAALAAAPAAPLALAAAPVAPVAPVAPAAPAAPAALAAVVVSSAVLGEPEPPEPPEPPLELTMVPEEPLSPEPMTMEVYQWTLWKEWVLNVSSIDTDHPYLEVGSRAYIPCVRLIEAWLLNPIGALPLSVDILGHEIESILNPFETTPWRPEGSDENVYGPPPPP